MSDKEIEIHAAEVSFYPIVSVATGNYPVFEFNCLESAMGALKYYPPEDGEDVPPIVVYTTGAEGYMILDNVFYKFPITQEEINSGDPYYYSNKANEER